MLFPPYANGGNAPLVRFGMYSPYISILPTKKGFPFYLRPQNEFALAFFINIMILLPLQNNIELSTLR